MIWFVAVLALILIYRLLALMTWFSDTVAIAVSRYTSWMAYLILPLAIVNLIYEIAGVPRDSLFSIGMLGCGGYFWVNLVLGWIFSGNEDEDIEFEDGEAFSSTEEDGFLRRPNRTLRGEWKDHVEWIEWPAQSDDWWWREIQGDDWRYYEE